MAEITAKNGFSSRVLLGGGAFGSVLCLPWQDGWCKQAVNIHNVTNG
jgi:hypothetical protein